MQLVTFSISSKADLGEWPNPFFLYFQNVLRFCLNNCAPPPFLNFLDPPLIVLVWLKRMLFLRRTPPSFPEDYNNDDDDDDDDNDNDNDNNSNNNNNNNNNNNIFLITIITLLNSSQNTKYEFNATIIEKEFSVVCGF